MTAFEIFCVKWNTFLKFTLLKLGTCLWPQHSGCRNNIERPCLSQRTKTQTPPKPTPNPKPKSELHTLSVYRETEVYRAPATKPRPRKWQRRWKFFSLARRQTPSIPALKRQRQTDFWVWSQASIFSEFQDSQSYTARPYLINKQTSYWLIP